MTTPTAKTALDRLTELEAAEAQARDEASALATEHHRKATKAQELLKRRANLVHREPGLVDHRGAPLDPDGEVAGIDVEVEALGDLSDLGARSNGLSASNRPAPRSYDVCHSARDQASAGRSRCPTPSSARSHASVKGVPRQALGGERNVLSAGRSPQSVSQALPTPSPSLSR